MNFVMFLITFFKIGLITYGGGLAMIPLLQDFAVSNDWINIRDFTDLIAISQSTPGPIAINLATFIGYKQYLLSGAFLASISVVLPGFIIALMISSFLQKFNEHKIVQLTLEGLKVSVIGLLGMAVYQVGRVAFFNSTSGFVDVKAIDLKAVILFASVLFAIEHKKMHPVVYLVCGGILGVIFW